jgi:hypothetical protein
VDNVDGVDSVEKPTKVAKLDPQSHSVVDDHLWVITTPSIPPLPPALSPFSFSNLSGVI